MPVDRRRYPLDWEKTSFFIRFVRAGGRCEWPGCTAVHGEPHPVTGSRVVLTTAHLGVPKSFTAPGDKHDKQDCRGENLLALCQMHHLRLDVAEHVENARRTRREKVARVQAALEFEP